MTTIQLVKGNNSIPWGFRLQGGKDFGAPLTVQRINPGSIASGSGLSIGDVILNINDKAAAGLKHKEAHDLIMNSQTNLSITVDRKTKELMGANKSSPSVTSPKPRPPAPPASKPAQSKQNEVEEVSPGSKPTATNLAILQKLSTVSKIPVCHVCKNTATGQYMTVMDKIWCRQHFVCHACGRSLMHAQFFEEAGYLYCKEDYESKFAPKCAKCEQAISEEIVNAMGKSFHVNCFRCNKCFKPIQGGKYHLNDGDPYCQKDWEMLFQNKCQSCKFAIEPGDEWIDALGSNWHTGCFKCTSCKKNLKTSGFYDRGGLPYCKEHYK